MIVQIERRASGARVVSAVHEVMGIAPDGDYALHEVFWRRL